MDAATQDYFRGVEDHFIQRRGRPLLLSPADVGRVAEWHAAGIPLATVIEGINVYFDRLTRRGRAPRRAVTLAFLEDDVHDAWAGARSRRMGRVGATASGTADGAAGVESAAAQALATAAEHVRILAALAEVETRLASGDAAATRVAGAVHQCREKLAKKADLFEPQRADHDEQKAEDLLRRLERALAAAAREAVGGALPDLEREVALELEGKRERMSEATLERVTTQLLDKKLRQIFGIPRLSLFYA